ncbi:GNAT family N-acetyltransferase [Streptomyces sp. NRRL B-1347]|uniref:GNAT family N-acetyltransferase n=1 Tax=Streptomyces sp. NRRL B-1347 TaxID=1476877 RepID=UPI0004C501EC|nr:GNAT family N-acetyltransferase [Streptomyces sp. NRRL B-1347]
MCAFLETARLVLRAFTDAEDDVDRLLPLDNDPEVMRFINGGRPVSREAIRTRVLPRLLHDCPCFGARGYWAAEEKSAGGFLGRFEFRPRDDRDATVAELGYRPHAAAWGKGYATEGSRALIAKGFTDLGVRRVTANTMAVNTRSRHVMEKAGLSYRGYLARRWPDPFEGLEHGEVEYGLTRDDWERTAGPEGRAG